MCLTGQCDECRRARSIVAVENVSVHTGTGEPYRGKFFKFRPKVALVSPREIPEENFFLRASLAAAADGSLLSDE